MFIKIFGQKDTLRNKENSLIVHGMLSLKIDKQSLLWFLCLDSSITKRQKYPTSDFS